MESISKAINPEFKKHACDNKDGVWYHYDPITCTEEDNYNRNRDYAFAYMEGDNYDDYDYAPAAFA